MWPARPGGGGVSGGGRRCRPSLFYRDERENEEGEERRKGRNGPGLWTWSLDRPDRTARIKGEKQKEKNGSDLKWGINFEEII